MTTPPLTYPGVYVQEVSSGVRPVQAASTSTAAFVGVTEMGPDEGAQLITSWVEFQRRFGSFVADSFLPQSVFQFFNNGGRLCYIVRVTRSNAAVASTTVANRAATPVAAGVTLRAASKGAWGNALVARIDDGTQDPDNTVRIRISRQADAAAIPTDFAALEQLEDHDNLGMDPDQPNYLVDVLARDSGLIRADVRDTTSVQEGFHRGATKPPLGLGTNLAFRIDVDGDGLQDVRLAAEVGPPNTSIEKVAEEIQKKVVALQPRRTTTSADAFTKFTCTVEGADDTARLVLKSGTTGTRSSVRVTAAGADDATAKLGIGVAGRSQGGLAVRRPGVVAVMPIGDATPAAPLSEPREGSDGTTDLTPAGYRTAFSRLDTVTDASLLAVPGEGSVELMQEGMAYCAGRPLQDMFFIGEESEEHVDERDEARKFRRDLTLANNYGAVYFPWILTPDPTGRSRVPVAVPPSGFVAGLYARTDATRGVWKAPAGTAAGINGAVGLTAELNDTDHGVLNLAGVNVIRRFPGTGIVSFGARTVTSDPEWLYIPVRRTAIMLRVSIYLGIQFAVFEPNDEPLWAQLRLNIGSFLNTLFRQGAFQGATPAQAYFVKCDDETTTQADIDRGVVNVMVGFAPLKPAEFVVVRISQQAGQAAG